MRAGFVRRQRQVFFLQIVPKRMVCAEGESRRSHTQETPPPTTKRNTQTLPILHRRSIITRMSVIMRGLGFLGLLLLRFATRVSGHPQCFYDGRPPNPEQILTFCPAATDGACCTDFEEEIVVARFGAVGDLLSSECADLYRQVSK